MNYIKHLNHWMELVDVDDRLTAHHISLYLSLFQVWNRSRFPEKIVISRNELFRLSKIGSSKTYYKCLHQLHEFGYIRYFPSHNSLRGSTVILVDLSDQNNDDQELIETESEPPKSGDDGASDIPKNFYGSQTNPQVTPKQNQHRSCGKNDTSNTQVVTPFKINNINLINSKHRKRGAREPVHNFKNEIKKINKDAGEKKKKHGLDHRYPSYSSADSCLESERIKISGRKCPTLDQVKAFFTSLDTQEISPMLLNHKDLELEAVKFFHHYEANGWLVGGKSPMRNWLSAGLSWMAKAPYFNRKFHPPGRPNPLHVDNNQQFGKPL